MNKYFVGIVGLLFLSVSCGAWEFVPGEVVREPGPVSRQIKDPNGKLCAAYTSVNCSGISRICAVLRP